MLKTIDKLKQDKKRLEKSIEDKKEECRKLIEEKYNLKQEIELLKENLMIQEQFEVLLQKKDSTIKYYQNKIECLKTKNLENKNEFEEKYNELSKTIMELNNQLTSLEKSKNTLDCEKTRTLRIISIKINR